MREFDENYNYNNDDEDEDSVCLEAFMDRWDSDMEEQENVTYEK